MKNLNLTVNKNQDEYAPKIIIQLPEGQDAYQTIREKLAEFKLDINPVYCAYGLEIYSNEEKNIQMLVDFDTRTIRIKGEHIEKQDIEKEKRSAAAKKAAATRAKRKASGHYRKRHPDVVAAQMHEDFLYGR